AGLASGLGEGVLKAIAVGTTKRLSEFPDLPTVAETFPGFYAAGWNVLVAPTGTPSFVVRKVSADLRTALDDNEVKVSLAKLGAYVNPTMSPEQLTAFIHEQQAMWKPVAEAVAVSQK